VGELAGNVMAFAIDANTGALTTIGSPVPAGSLPKHVAVDPSGKFAYVGRSNQVISYRIEENGVLTQTGSLPAPVNTDCVAVDPTAKFVYALGRDIGMFRIDEATGVLSANGTIALSPQAGTSDIKIHPNGRFVYVLNQADESISVFAADNTTGLLTNIPGNLFDVAPSNPNSIAIDPSGRFAFVAQVAIGSPTLMVFGIDVTSGALTLLGSPGAGRGPTWAAVHPSGQFLYVANFQDNTISAFAVDGNGTLTPAGTFVTGGGPISIAIDSTGSFAYAANSGDDSISIYSIDLTTGALTLQGAPFAVPPGTGLSSIVAVGSAP
jgi:6-phosphogluconolactonase (cycloisomerase 2 family)